MRLGIDAAKSPSFITCAPECVTGSRAVCLTFHLRVRGKSQDRDKAMKMPQTRQIVFYDMKGSYHESNYNVLSFPDSVCPSLAECIDDAIYLRGENVFPLNSVCDES